jgi:hypothetical protein
MVHWLCELFWSALFIGNCFESPPGKGVSPVPRPLTPEEFEATRNACALAIARNRERVLAWRDQRLEIMMVTRVQIEQSRDLMAWADASVAKAALLKGRV